MEIFHADIAPQNFFLFNCELKDLQNEYNINKAKFKLVDFGDAFLMSSKG